MMFAAPGAGSLITVQFPSLGEVKGVAFITATLVTAKQTSWSVPAFGASGGALFLIVTVSESPQGTPGVVYVNTYVFPGIIATLAVPFPIETGVGESIPVELKNVQVPLLERVALP